MINGAARYPPQPHIHFARDRRVFEIERINIQSSKRQHVFKQRLNNGAVSGGGTPSVARVRSV
jgi:hypothetical protein